MGFNNGYDSGYSDALEDVRSGKVAGLGPAGGGADGAARQRYSAVRVAGGDPKGGGLGLSDEDVLSVTMEDLGVDSTSGEPQTMDFDRIADKLAPVVVLDVFWNVSTPDISAQGPEGYNWQYLEDHFSPGGGTCVVLAVSGDYYVQT